MPNRNRRRLKKACKSVMDSDLAAAHKFITIDLKDNSDKSEESMISRMWNWATGSGNQKDALRQIDA